MDITNASADYRCPAYSDFPALALYMDQVVGFLNEAVAPFYQDTPNPVTPSMINNYVKQNVISRPEKKKYSREQVISLYMIFLLKQVLRIDQVAALLQTTFSAHSVEEGFGLFRNHLEQALSRLHDLECDPPFSSDPLLEAAVRSLVYQQYTVLLLNEEKKEKDAPSAEEA